LRLGIYKKIKGYKTWENFRVGEDDGETREEDKLTRYLMRGATKNRENLPIRAQPIIS